MRWLVNVTACGVLLSSLPTAQLAFEGRVDIDAQGGVSSVVVGDVDADGDPDVITFGTPTAVHLNQGDGSFGRAIDLAMGSALDSRLAHLDADGHLDLVRSLGNSVFVHMGNGDGSFTPGVEIHVSPNNPIRTLEVGDLTGDGIADVITTSGEVLAGQMEVDLVPGLGDGTFGVASKVQGPYFQFFPMDVEIGDLDRDGNPDMLLLMNTLAESHLRVYLGTGAGAPAFSTSIGIGSERAGDVLLADPDADGKLDILIGGAFGVGTIHGNGDGSFGSASLWTGRSTFDRMVLGDFDGDGLDDIAYRAGVGWDMVVLAGAADGSFSEVYDMTSLGTVVDVAAADFDVDGRPDLVFGDYSGDDTFAILRNHTYPPGGPWTDLGFDLAADNTTDNFPPASPILVADGSLLAGEVLSVKLWRNRSVASDGWLVLGLGAALAPFKGGTFVPTPTIMIGPFVNMSNAAPLEFAGILPAGLPSGTQLWLQAWFVYAPVPFYSATTGLQGTVP
jgi:hypothetical protein